MTTTTTTTTTRLPAPRDGEPDQTSLLGAGRVEAQGDGSSRWYNHPETGAPYLSVTHVIGAATSKPWLAPWAAKIAAQYAVDFSQHWHATFRKDGRDAAVKEITTTAAANREIKADIGTFVHDVIEAMLTDAPTPGIPDHLDGRIVEWDEELIVISREWLDQIVDGFLAFVEDFQFEPEAAECTVASDEHQGAGTVDFMGRLGVTGEIIGGDTKTGAHLGREMLAQVGAYDKFDQVWLRSGLVVPRPALDGWAILHLRPSYARGYKLIRVTRAELDLGWEWWLACRAQVSVAEQVSDRFGRAFYPPLPDGSQPAPMVEDLRSAPGCSRAVKPLAKANITWLSDLAVLDRAEVLKLPGVGPKTVDALASVMAEHNLTFNGEQKSEVA